MSKKNINVSYEKFIDLEGDVIIDFTLEFMMFNEDRHRGFCKDYLDSNLLFKKRFPQNKVYYSIQDSNYAIMNNIYGDIDNIPVNSNCIGEDIESKFCGRLSSLVGSASEDFIIMKQGLESLKNTEALGEMTTEQIDSINQFSHISIPSKIMQKARDYGLFEALYNMYSELLLGEGLILKIKDKDKVDFVNLTSENYTCYSSVAHDLEVIMLPRLDAMSSATNGEGVDTLTGKCIIGYTVYINQRGKHRRLIVGLSDKNRTRNSDGQHPYIVKENAMTEKLAFYCRTDRSLFSRPRDSMAKKVIDDVKMVSMLSDISAKTETLNRTMLFKTLDGELSGISLGDSCNVPPNMMADTVDKDGNISEFGIVNGSSSSLNTGNLTNITRSANKFGMGFVHCTKTDSMTRLDIEPSVEQESISYTYAMRRIYSILGIVDVQEETASGSIQIRNDRDKTLSSIVTRIRTDFIKPIIKDILGNVLKEIGVKDVKIVSYLMSGVGFYTELEKTSSASRTQGIVSLLEITQQAFGQQSAGALNADKLLGATLESVGLPNDILNPEGINIIQENNNVHNEALHIQSQQAHMENMNADTSIKNSQAQQNSNVQGQNGNNNVTG